MEMGGLATPQVGPVNPYKYNGKELHEELGLGWYDYGARYNDASLGRWHSVDALADDPNQIDKSPMAYAWNNPVYYTDPDGNCPDCPQWANSFGDWLRTSWAGSVERKTNDYTPPPEVGETIASLTPVTSAINVVMIPTQGEDLFGNESGGVDFASNAADFIPGEKLVKTGGGILWSIGARYTDEVFDFMGNLKYVDDFAEGAVDGSKTHGNSKLSTKTQHGYVIKDENGDVLEYGISGQKLKADGTSPRIDQKLGSKHADKPGAHGEILETNLPNRVEGLDWEQNMVNKHKEKFGWAPVWQIRPQAK